MNSSGGSNAFTIISLLVIIAFVLLLLRHYLTLRKTPAYFILPIFLALALPISIILLVPIDLASNSRSDDEKTRGIWLPEGVLLVGWRLTYWLTFALTWAILPLLGEYVDSGYRAPKDKFFYSLRSNGRYYLIVFVCAGLAGIYVFLVNGFKTGSLKSLVMALAYCYGLIMAIYLMGHGFVTIPRELFRNAHITRRLRSIQSEATKVHDKSNNATNELEELEAQLTQLRKRKNAVSRDHEEWIEEISDFSSVASYQSSTTARVTSPDLPAVITDRYLAEFARKLMRARHKKIRFVAAWNQLVESSIKAQAIVDSQESKRLDRTSLPQSKIKGLNILTPHTRYLFHTKLIPFLRLTLGIIFTLASISITWSELIKSISPKLSIISLTTLSHPTSTTPQLTLRGQILSSLWLLYMSLTTLSSIPRIKVWGNRALIPRHTYLESAAWYSSQVAKLTVPLAYNFLTFLPKPVAQETTFYAFLGVTINLTPLGTGFDYIFPIFILIPISAALFNIYGRTSRFFGSSFIDADDSAPDSATGSWREGRDLINRELQSWSRTRLEDHTNSAGGRVGVGAGRARSPPLLTIPPYRDHDSDPHTPSYPSNRPPLLRQPTTERQAQRLAAATAAAEEEDEGVFQGFAHRVKNTFDTIERPGWLDELTKKPKWMGGDESTRPSEESGRAESGRGLGKWFGGRPADGRVRL